jgi:hypothetical protein
VTPPVLSLCPGEKLHRKRNTFHRAPSEMPTPAREIPGRGRR